MDADDKRALWKAAAIILAILVFALAAQVHGCGGHNPYSTPDQNY